MARSSSSNGLGNGRSLLPLALVLLLAAVAVVQAFVLPCASTPRAQRATAPRMMAADGLDNYSRRGSLQRTAGASLAVGALLLTRPGQARAAAGGDPREALKRVIVVRDSTAQLRDELENGTDIPDPNVRGLVTALLKNYQLKDSLEAALSLGGFSEAGKEAAVGHAKAAVEDLSIIIEYFPADLEGPIQDKIRLKPDELQFTLKALAAAGTELSNYLKKFPRDVVDGLTQEINSA